MIRVLIADDEEDLATSTADWLRGEGFEVEVAHDAGAIRVALAARPPDVLLQDVRMPDLDLDVLFAKVRADGALRHMAIILFTAAVDGRELGLRHGADAVVSKPFEPEELADAIRRCAERSYI